MWHKPCRTFHPWCPCIKTRCLSLQWRHNERDCVLNHRRIQCLLNRLFRRGSKKTSNIPGGFPSQRAGNAENVSISWRHHVIRTPSYPLCMTKDLYYLCHFSVKKLLNTKIITMKSYESIDISNHRQIDFCSTDCSYSPQKHRISALLIFCEGNPPVAVGFLSQRTSDVGSNNINPSYVHDVVMYMWRVNGQESFLLTWINFNPNMEK